MSEAIIRSVLEASFTAGIAAIAVMLLRIPMKRLPKKWSYMLWAVVFFRCLCPFSFESAVSIFNVFASEQSTSVQVTEAIYDPHENHVTEYYVRISPDDPIYKDYSGNAEFNRTAANVSPGTSETSRRFDRESAVFIMWATGVMVMVWYAVISYVMLMEKVRAAVKMPDGAYETDMISTAFTAGFFVPKIYLPCGLSENDRRLIIAHEKVHIRRFDHILKPLAFAGLALHWFNPLIWAAFALMAKDMELSCDEAVLEALGQEEKENYSEALLKVSMKKSGLAAVPTAFAEVGVKDRVKNVLEYKKPGFVGNVLAALIVVSSCAVLGTNAANEPVSYGSIAAIQEVSIMEGAEQIADFAVIFQEEEAVSDTAAQYVSDSESENYSYAVYASDEGYSEKTYDVIIAYPDGIIEEFSIAGTQLLEISDLSSAGFSVTVSDASDTEYPVYITVDEALSSAIEEPILHGSGEYTMSKLYEPYGMYYDYQKNCYIYNGEPVRFFYDPVEGASFTNYFTGTTDLEAVYENDVLVGVTECSDEAYAIHDEKQELFSSILPATSIVALPDASIIMVK